MDLIDIYGTFHLKTAEYIFFSSAHRTFSRVDHTLDHKLSLGKFKKIEIISSIFFFFFLLFMAAGVAYGSSQARGQNRAIAAGLTTATAMRSELHL